MSRQRHCRSLLAVKRTADQIMMKPRNFRRNEFTSHTSPYLTMRRRPSVRRIDLRLCPGCDASRRSRSSIPISVAKDI